MNPFQEADLEEAGATDFPFGSPVEVCEYWASTQNVPPHDSQKIEERAIFDVQRQTCETQRNLVIS